MVSSLFYLLIELLITKNLGLTEKKVGKEGHIEKIQRIFNFNSKTAIVLALLQLVYCILLINGFYKIELCLPYINLLSWMKLIQELAQFEIIRKFLIIFRACLKSLIGFIIFFVLILLTFATTDAIIKKSLFRYDLVKNITGDYSEEFYREHDAYIKKEKKLEDLLESIRTILVAMIQGDYWVKIGEEDRKVDFYNLFLMVIFTFMPNVIFLNLTVAILGDSYEESITAINEKCLRD